MTETSTAKHMKLTVVKVLPERKFTNKAGQPSIMCDFTAEGDDTTGILKFSGFKDKLEGHLREGAVLDCEVTSRESGQTDDKGAPIVYRTVQKLNAVDEQPVAKSPGRGYFRSSSPEERTSIERQCSMKCAMEFHNSLKLPLADRIFYPKVLYEQADWVCHIAEIFFNWIHTETIINRLNVVGSLPAPVSGTLGSLSEAKTRDEKQGQSEKPEPEKASEPPTMTEQDLLKLVMEHKKYKNPATAQSWLYNVCKIPPERIVQEPDIVYKELAELNGWG